MYEKGGLEVEVVDADGETIGVVTVLESQLRAAPNKSAGKPKRQ